MRLNGRHSRVSTRLGLFATLIRQPWICERHRPAKPTFQPEFRPPGRIIASERLPSPHVPSGETTEDWHKMKEKQEEGTCARSAGVSS